VFFFSSRRRHTRWPRDWSSDVCSSDLKDEGHRRPAVRLLDPLLLVQAHGWTSMALVFLGRHDDAIAHGAVALRLAEARGDELVQIGRASGRERGGRGGGWE